jgi:hypothetical protein
VHPPMLRHSTGYKLANQGEDTRSLAHYLGIEIYNRPPDTLRLRLIDLRSSGRTSVWWERGGDTSRKGGFSWCASTRAKVPQPSKTPPL